MADVQINNGQFTRIANVLLEKISQAKLNGTQYAIILFVWRYTYGFQRCEHEMSLSFLSSGINTDTRMVRRELQKLINDNVITVVKESDNINPRTIKVNKDYDTWKVVWRGLKSPEGSKKTSPERTKKTPRREVELDPQERKSFKENSKESKECKINLFEFLKICKDSLPHDEYFGEHNKPHPNYYMIQEFSKLPKDKKTGTLVRIYLDLFPEQKKIGIAGSIKANQIFSALIEYPMCPDHETVLKLLLYHEGGNLTPWDVERKIKELRPGETTKEQMCYSMDEGMAQQNGQALF